MLPNLLHLDMFWALANVADDMNTVEHFVDIFLLTCGSNENVAGNDIGGASPSRWRSRARRSSRFHLCFVLCNIVFVGNFMCLEILPGLAFKKMHEQVEADVDLFLGARRVGGTTGFVLPRVVRLARGARVRPCTLRPIGRTPCRSAPRSTDGTRTTSS